MLGQFLAIFTNPGSLLFALLLLALPLSWWRATRRAGMILGSFTLTVVVVIGLLPLNDWLLRPLEDYFPSPELPARVDGIIVLGGAERPDIMAVRGWPELNGNADRLIAFVDLAARYPAAKLVFSGGAAVPHEQGEVSEADVAAVVFAKLGLNPGRVIFERMSGNTIENARLSLALARPQPGEFWLLVTSARHQPRAVNCFNAVNWPVVPYPVDFLTGKSGDFEFSPMRRLSGLNFLVKEWLGLAWYRLAGHTRDWLPPRRTADAKP
ncbi:MAG: YdcF family protein [Ferrovibrio sp.]|uniref:YdcF family protein n=1 Tax=Ferrovibrio sp. TaxID=1917215 RepID=UPI002609686A|nr:YdcF family protein [Ferrovibrio sp.]MCW0235320.1 YdcF family protein [Ferrovibrio sp.]